MKSSLALRLVFAATSIAITATIFTAVISNAEQPQADGTVRLAHTVIGSPQVFAPVQIAQAKIEQVR